MFRFLMGLAALGTIVGAVVGALAIGGVLDLSDSGCPYGYRNTASSQNSSCKSRPEPKPAQMAAVLDGSAIANGLRAFKKSKEAKATVLGVGLNAYGETTFTIPDGENLFGAPEQRHVTFDRDGASAPSNNAFRRRYATSTSTEKVVVGEIRPSAMKRALARVRRGAPDATFKSALFSRRLAAAGSGWALQYSIGEGNSIRGFIVEMAADGSGLCVFGVASEVRGLKACQFGLPGAGSVAPSSPGSAPSSVAPPAAQSKQLDCVQKAAGDVQKMQACITG